MRTDKGKPVLEYRIGRRVIRKQRKRVKQKNSEAHIVYISNWGILLVLPQSENRLRLPYRK